MVKRSGKGNFIREKEFYRYWWSLALPISVQALITVGVNVVDTLMLSQLAEAQISASSLAGSYMGVFNILSMGIGFGANVMASQFWGAGDRDSFRKTVALIVRICVAVGLVVAAVTFLLPEQIMRLYSSEADVIRYGASYLRYIAVALLFIMLGQPLSFVIRSAGKANVALYATLGAFVMNIIINWIFIFGNLGAPRMEIAGAALGTMISYIFQCLVVWVYVFAVDKKLGCRIRDIFRPSGGLGRLFIRYSLPVVVSDLMIGLGNNAVSIVMGHIGSWYVTANAVISVLVRLLSAVCNGLSNSSAVVVGQTIGKGDREEAYRQGVTCTWVSLGLGVAVAVVSLLVGGPYIGIYNLSDTTRQTAYELLYASAVISLFMMTSSTLTKGILRGAGDTKYLMVLDTVFLWLVSLPLGALAGLVFHFPPFWIYLCLYSERFIRTVVALFRLKGKRWIHSVQVKTTQGPEH